MRRDSCTHLDRCEVQFMCFCLLWQSRQAAQARCSGRSVKFWKWGSRVALCVFALRHGLPQWADGVNLWKCGSCVAFCVFAVCCGRCHQAERVKLWNCGLCVVFYVCLQSVGTISSG